MASRLGMLWSTVGKKVFAALTGLALVGFVIVHLGGNLLLLHPNPHYYNAYSHHLISLGPLLWVAEALLLGFFLFHFVTGAWVTLTNWQARGSESYTVTAYAGDPSRKTLSSRSMIISGLVILTFTVIHLFTFKFGHYYETEDGLRDFYRLAFEVFSSEAIVIWYVVAMCLLFMHLRHGFWSAFQSLGAMNRRLSNVIYAMGLVLALLLAIGYIGIPIFVYIKGKLI
jgi:succinate dehydrogenase / fumarate reductase cytochrome b subunit